MEKVKGVVLALFLWAFLIADGHAWTNYQNWYELDNNITMDIDTDSGGGTLICPSVRACYTWVLYAEARGASEYCNSITIFRNGKPIWSRKYW